MKTYGTIPTSSSPGGANLEYLSRAKERLKSGLSTRRPWKEMLNLHWISLPRSAGEAIGRIRTNFSNFQMHYAIVVLLILFISLLRHPILMIVFFVMMGAWLFLCFLRDEPHRAVLIVIAVVTILLILLTHTTVNILVSLLIGAVVVVAHASLRNTDDLFLGEESAGLLRRTGTDDLFLDEESAGLLRRTEAKVQQRWDGIGGSKEHILFIYYMRRIQYKQSIIASRNSSA